MTTATKSDPPARPTTTCPAAASGVRILQQCDALVARLSDDAYRAEAHVLAGGTIGKHVRHTLDHFAAVVDALATPGQPIDYDHRRRGVPVETDRALARTAIAALVERLAALQAPVSSGQVAVRVMLAEDGSEAVLASTVGRELAFAAHHAVHHHAMIKAIAEDLGVRCPEGFGRAPSTLHHERAAGPATEARPG